MHSEKVTQKERLIRTLNGLSVDRPPVICPGGMMNAAVTEIVEDMNGNHNTDLEAMIASAKQVHEKTGFENYGVPFCMTAEVEPLGAVIDYGHVLVEPRVTQYSKLDMEALADMSDVDVTREPRMVMVVEAIKALKNDEIPVIGNITGHISTASSAVDPNEFFKSLIRNPMISHKLLTRINKYLISYAIKMIEAGADVIAISDPTATGEILGERLFRAFALPYYKQLVDEIKPYDVPMIFHMCGKAYNVIDALDEAGFQALSFDSLVSMQKARSKVSTCLMGNVNTQALNDESEDKVRKLTDVCLKAGVDIVSPACGLGMSTPVKNIRAMSEFVKSYGEL